VVDVGADHGRLAALVNGIATERMPHRRLPGATPTWVIADGLRPFRRVDVALIAGMGAHRIASILSASPQPTVAVVVQPNDKPPTMRRWLADNSYRIDAEGIAKERGRIYEIIRAIPGTETSSGLTLDYGPAMLDHGHPLLVLLLDKHIRRLEAISAATSNSDPSAFARAQEHLTFLRRHRERWS